MRLDYYLIACLTCDSLHQAKAAVQRRRPFTLIELLVVVAIIAVLAAMLLPAMSKARDASQRVACLSQLRQIGIVSLEYAEANDDQFTHWYAYSSTIVPTTTHEDTWKMLVADYGLTTTMSQCPTIDINARDVGGNLLYGKLDWAGPAFLTAFRIGYSAFIASMGQRGITGVTGVPIPPTSAPLSLLDSPDKVIGADLNLRLGGDWSSRPDFKDFIAHRSPTLSPTGGNTVFLDGHARWTPAGQMGANGAGIYMPNEGNYDYQPLLERDMFWGVIP